MGDYLKKLTGNGKTLAFGGAAVLVKIITPIAKAHGLQLPDGFEDAVATVLLFLMGFVGLGSKDLRADDKVEAVHSNVAALTSQVVDLQASEDARKAKVQAEEQAAIDAKKKAEDDEKANLEKEVEDLKKQLQNAK